MCIASILLSLHTITTTTTVEGHNLIKRNKRESRYSTRSMVLIKSARVTDRIRTCAISNSDSKSNVLDSSAIGTPKDSPSPQDIYQNITNLYLLYSLCGLKRLIMWSEMKL
ncbi:hypothetical protein J6590_058899 [Homalodisca vitripennis]|nr:hypothetical protein J6590_058899 [Homalodisca vitripennis]